MLESSGKPVEVTLFTRRNCRLCDEAKEVILQVARKGRLLIQLREIDVDGDPRLVARHGTDVPVVYVAGRYACRHRVEPARFLELLLRPDRERMEEDLTMSNCQPCSGGMKPLGAEQAANLLTRIDRSWGVVDDHHLRRKFTFGDFRSALAFANRVGEIAEEEAHHPDITIGYGRVVIELWTHAAGGLTSNDFILAAKIDRISPMP